MNKQETIKKTKLAIATLTLSSSVTIIPAFAADLTASSSVPWVTFDDTSSDSPGNDWRFSGSGTPTGGYMRLYDFVGSNDHTVFSFDTTGGSTNNENSLIVDSSGDVNLANGSVFIDRSANRIGIGTTIPEAKIHIKASFEYGLTMEETSGGNKWSAGPNTGGFWLNRVIPNSAFGVLKFNDDAPANSIVAHAVGIGMGTSSPESALHIKRDGAVLTVEDTSAGGVSNIIKLKRPGSVGFSMENTALGEAWDFRTNGTGGFLVSNIGVPGSKFQINLDGRVFMAGTNFDLKPDGTLTLAGNSNALQHVDTSSRESKTDFEKVNAKEVMDKIKTLEVSKWRYKDTSAKGRHIGPVAEDFYSLFKLGADDKHIAARDIASIALIAAKELQEENTQLKTQLQDQEERLASLEKLVTNLAAGESIIRENGAQVAKVELEK